MNLKALGLSLLTLPACLLPCTLVAALGSAQDTGDSVYARPGQLLVRAARLLDPRTGNVLSPAAVLIEGDKINQVGSPSQISAPGGAKTIDLGNATLLPGLIDSHTRLLMDCVFPTEAHCLRVDRGGSWMFPAWLLRPATQERNLADYRDDIMGFRVAKTLPYFAASGRARVPAPGTQFRDCANGCPEMVMLPRGRFVMGAPPGEEERENAPDYFRGHSVPQHWVTIQHSFAIAKFDVRRDEYAQFVAETKRPDPDTCYTPDPSGGESDKKDAKWHSPGFPQTGRDPVVCVNWDDAQAYVAWLSAKTGHVYRLSTEAEWEYAARSGTTTARYGSDRPAELCHYINHADLDFSEQHPRESDVNRACRDGFAFTSPVGSFPPNRFGLYDMLGNVWQWTEDCWNDDYKGAPSDGSSWQTGNCGRRVMRGGAYSLMPALVRSSVRLGSKSSARDHSGGFRVARTIE